MVRCKQDFPILPYVTWGLIQDPQNKRGIPEKIINIIYDRRKYREEDTHFRIYTTKKTIRREEK